jgi:hypothetical protein
MRTATAVTKVALGPYGEPLVNDFRLDKVYVHLSRLVKFPPELQFATQLQEAIPSPDPETIKGQPEVAVFMIISPHPKAGTAPYAKNQMITTVASMKYTDWKEANDEYRHYAGLADPLRPIFAGMLRQHMAKLKDFEELMN